ncbi:MAG TPA: FHA domain-containing protein [Pseudonocardia sp.]|nr:FHA domain-containing protein [Pseudonocardia sp.]
MNPTGGVTFDSLRCAVAAGDGVVARFPGVLCAARAVPHRELSLLPSLIDACRESAGVAPGRTLARRLTAWLGSLGGQAEGLTFGTVAATAEDGLAVFLLGDARLLIPDLDTALSGTDGAAWTDRLLARPQAPLVLTAASGAAIALDAAAGLYDLRAGVVPGAGAVLLNLDASRTERVPPAGAAPARPPAPVGSRAMPVLAPRRPLGLLVFDGGTTYPVDAHCLIGRNPVSDDRVGQGDLRLVTVEDRSGSMSRLHAEIRLNGRDVTLVDSDSSNGTFVSTGNGWRQLSPREAVRLTPGARVRLGDTVSFVFSALSPSGAGSPG